MPQKFRVPQFIDVEDKILGPITTRQFGVLIVGFLMAFIGYKIFDFTAFVVWAIIWLGVTAVISFMKVNGMPFHYFLLNIIQTSKRSSIRLWNKNLSDSQIKALAARKPEVKKKEDIPSKAPLSFSSLSELSLVADTGGSYKGETVLTAHRQDTKNKPLNQKLKK